MAFEDEMKRQITVIEKEIFDLDKELQILNEKTHSLMMKRQKKERDLLILKTNFYPSEQKPTQMSLAKMLKA